MGVTGQRPAQAGEPRPVSLPAHILDLNGGSTWDRGCRVGSVRDWWWGDQNIAQEARVGAINLQVKGLGAWRP